MGDTWTYQAEVLKVIAATKQEPEWFLRFLVLDDTSKVILEFREYSNSFFFLKPLALLYMLTGNSYWWSGVYLSLFSFWGCWFLVLQLRQYYPAFGSSAIISFLFFPSVVFWTSGVLKDSVLMGSLCLSVGLLLQLYHARSAPSVALKVLLLLPCLYLFWRIKFFLAAVLVVLMGTFLLTKWATGQFPWVSSKTRQGILWASILLVGILVASFAHPAFTINFFVEHLVHNYRSLSQMTDPSNPVLSFPHLQPSLGSILWHAPSAILQILFRPFLWEPAPLFYKFMALENLFLQLLTATTVLYLLRRRQLPRLPSCLGVLLVFFFLSAVLVTLPTPNLGSLHRYRAPLLPFFLTVVLAWGPIPVWLDRVVGRRE
ncbi:hypothetical protein ACD591_01575 [Rufibacter glacialis]|uniref:Glycosyltransferase RgtA/B/C/D-like domain-containing protein n=1 Tax=Rufibacter glacialis TaxID=1259555 RepID=A0A5M8QLR0_9BACT|nr:hypothetical protein [Rufibacter glacialis]KAA6435583.1 hypothetical protein FOE74_06475 [Rufibacter glacialis]